MYFQLCLTVICSLSALGIDPADAGGNPPNITSLKYLGEVPLPGSNISTTKAYYKSEHKKSWFEAWYFCRELGLFLASVDSELQQSKLQNFLKDDRVREWWLSGTDLGHTKRFVWMSNGNYIPRNSTETGGYQNWSQGQPDFATRDAQNCVRLWDTHGLKSKWDDNKCTNSYHFICERGTN